MASRVCVLDLPGLSAELIKRVPAGTALGRWLAGRAVAELRPSFPAVTCSVQATLTTGTEPGEHGIVANGLPTFRFPQDATLVDASNFAEYRRSVSFWEQSNQFLERPRFWQDGRGRSKYKTALLFFQNSMPGFAGEPRPAADVVLTPKPDHGPDGKLTSLCWSEPRELVGELFAALGPFPLMNYWGPMANVASSAWIAKAAARVWETQRPQLQLVYVPHLDYDLQRFGPSSEQAARAVEDVAEAIEPIVSRVLDDGGQLVLLSEYGMTDVTTALRPNVEFARAGLLRTRATPDGRLIDYVASDAFAIIDHQVAHVYAQSAAAKDAVKRLAADWPVSLLDTAHPMMGDRSTHRRSGDLVLVSDPDAWFDYRWWADDGDAPAFAGAVDIHRKPGYDPLELFWEPAAKRIATDASRVRGSHGSPDGTPGVFVAASGKHEGQIEARDVAAVVESMIAGT